MHNLDSQITVSSNFPAGNGVIEYISEHSGEIHVGFAPDFRDSSRWFYWHIRVQNAEGKTVHFKIDPAFIGVRGPAICTDSEYSWRWIGADSVTADGFCYTFLQDESAVHFSVTMPYFSVHLEAFLNRYRNTPSLHRSVLATSRAHRAVPLIQIENVARKNSTALVMTARNHCCETMGSYVQEGVMDAFLAEDKMGEQLRNQFDCFVVPFMDFDGVENGDQGKNRSPHDHNRDFGKDSIYPEVRAIKSQLPQWLNGRPFIFIDFHCPALREGLHEVIQFLENADPVQRQKLETYLRMLEATHRGTLHFNAEMRMKFGTYYNTLAQVPPPNASGWAHLLDNCLFATTLEIPYANASGDEVNADSARLFGYDMARAFHHFLTTQS